jgi:hypothetical protein
MVMRCENDLLCHLLQLLWSGVGDKLAAFDIFALNCRDSAEEFQHACKRVFNSEEMNPIAIRHWGKVDQVITQITVFFRSPNHDPVQNWMKSTSSYLIDIS